MMKNHDLTGSKILLVEDEESLAIGLEYNLTHEGYKVERASDGRRAIDLIESHVYDVVILDIMLPYLDGFDVAKKIREKFPQMPILMLTARTGIKDRVKGLEVGADDYLTKPFHLQELLMRIKGMLTRKQWYKTVTKSQPIFKFGINSVNFENLICQTSQGTIRLTTREAMVLKYLIEHKGKIVTRQELLENVWQISSEVETRTVDNFIVRLRKYFEPDPAKPAFIKSIRSAGYMFSD
jgi:DNA-binding response OmpR family regulator